MNGQSSANALKLLAIALKRRIELEMRWNEYNPVGLSVLHTLRTVSAILIDSVTELIYGWQSRIYIYIYIYRPLYKLDSVENLDWSRSRGGAKRDRLGWQWEWFFTL